MARRGGKYGRPVTDSSHRTNAFLQAVETRCMYERVVEKQEACTCNKVQKKEIWDLHINVTYACILLVGREGIRLILSALIYLSLISGPVVLLVEEHCAVPRA